MAAALLKDQINSTLLSAIAQSCSHYYPAFRAEDFLQQLQPALAELELKQRIRQTAATLYQSLDLPFAQACEVLKPVSSHFGGIPGFIFPELVEQFGLQQPDIALDALGHFTRFSTSEFAIRPFLQLHPQQTLVQMLVWAEDKDHHLRRLASEGCRPRLPWGRALPEFQRDASPILPILEKLKADPSDYVRRSVANNLNDISKDQPELVLALAGRWQGQSEESNWIIKHALRTLLKKRHPDALALFGYQKPQLQASLQLGHTQLQMGEQLQFEVQLQSQQALGKLRLEYAIDFASKSGKSRHKVFQLLERTVAEPELQLSRSYRFVDMTTRKHYPGQHQLHLIINGQIYCSAPFELQPTEAG
ncbi:DNA alkylation repair protein [Rheinheimera sp.]|uniref:DNA alkylation repair protein n=1 Tax=Rheinheimera sp. TaxID=1869214 RepID=UPI0027B93474|nr:DNA alkylation repair protein [Rheinheimera sp.]